MEEKVIDYEQTIKKFFDSVCDFLDKKTNKVKTKKQYEDIIKNINIIRKIQEEPRRLSSYETRLWEELEPKKDGFVKIRNGKIVDNTAYLTFREALHAIDDFYNTNSSDKEKRLLNAIKNWSYVKSSLWFKDFVFPFKRAESFAVWVPKEAGKQNS